MKHEYYTRYYYENMAREALIDIKVLREKYETNLMMYRSHIKLLEEENNELKMIVQELGKLFDRYTSHKDTVWSKSFGRCWRGPNPVIIFGKRS